MLRSSRAHVHLPEMHNRPALQLRPHAPQLAGLVDRFAQPDRHCTVPAGQAQVPLTHVWPVRHAVAQEPQFLASLATSAQVPPQLT